MKLKQGAELIPLMVLIGLGSDFVYNDWLGDEPESQIHPIDPVARAGDISSSHYSVDENTRIISNNRGDSYGMSRNSVRCSTVNKVSGGGSTINDGGCNAESVCLKKVVFCVVLGTQSEMRW